MPVNAPFAELGLLSRTSIADEMPRRTSSSRAGVTVWQNLGRRGPEVKLRLQSQLHDIRRSPPHLVAFAVSKHKSYQPK